MSRKDTLTSLYIRGGLNWFNKAMDNALAKKKGKKLNISATQGEQDYNLYNFISVEKIKRPQYFIAREQLKYYNKDQNQEEGPLNVDKRLKVQEDIEKFRILVKKIIKNPSFGIEKKEGALSKQYIIREQIKKWFVDDDFEKYLIANKEQLRIVKQSKIQNHIVSIPVIDHKMQILKNQFKRFIEIKQLHQSINSGPFKAPQVQTNSEVITERKQALISSFMDNLFEKIVVVSQFKDFLVKPRIIKEWDSRKVLEEEAKLASFNIKGKHLYAIRRNLQIEKINQWDSHKQKRYGIHQQANERKQYEPELQIQGPVQYRRPQKARGEMNSQQKQDYFKQKQNNQDHHMFQAQIFDRPNSKSQFNPVLPKKAPPYINSDVKKYKIRHVDASNIAEFKKQMNGDQIKINYGSNVPAQIQQFRNRYKKPSPLSLDNINQFAYQPQKTMNRKGQVYVEPSFAKILKYPIKIDVLELYSAESSMICYHIDDICLKKLSLKFIEDRLKYKENRVKIQFPSRYSPQQQIKVMKSMTILNCLGAEVFSEIQSSYSHWNQTDVEDVLAVSWMLELPVREVVNLYSSYLTAASTKRM